jgi:DinB superfamily
MNAVTLTALAEFPRHLEAHYAAIPVDYKNWAPQSWEGIPSEPFTAIEQIAHVRDIEIDGYQVRIHRMLNELNPTLVSIDGEALARARSYATAEPTEIFDTFQQARSLTIDLVSGLTSEQFSRRAVFPGYGSLTLRSLVHYLCSHDQQHLAGLQWLLGKIEASRVPAGPDPSFIP